ncbi:MAG: hypothetical protein LBO80_08245 [Treponema sp.]|jgi:hypothetical protein|nr:hypothetical protein [Treponema sp.]
MKGYKIILVIAALILPGPAFSQDAGTEVFAPFVSRITAEVKNNLVRLNWVDSRDIRGPVFVYRSREPFVEGIPSSRPVEVAYGVQTHIDEVESPGAWHYYVIASDGEGRKYTVPIPFNNTLSVVIEGIETAPRTITGLEAALDGDGVIISFQGAGRTDNAILYRSPKPLREERDLLEAAIVQSGIGSPFTDYPVPGIPYYYGVVLEDDLISGKTVLFPGQNSTLNPVEVPRSPGRSSAGGDMRAMPLPRITVNTAVPGRIASEPPVPAALSAEAVRAIAGLRSQNTRPVQDKAPRAFNQDLEGPAGGEDGSLRSIVQGPFIRRDWNTSREELIRYLSLPRSAAAEARGRYYLGQSYYFLERPREALFEFLSVQAHYPGEASEWIQAALGKITN